MKLCRRVTRRGISYFLVVSWDEVRLSPLGTSAIVWPIYQPRMMDDDDCGAVGGISGRRNRSIPRKPASVPL
jgi:hypothetical protein